MIEIFLKRKIHNLDLGRSLSSRSLNSSIKHNGCGEFYLPYMSSTRSPLQHAFLVKFVFGTLLKMWSLHPLSRNLGWLVTKQAVVPETSHGRWYKFCPVLSDHSLGTQAHIRKGSWRCSWWQPHLRSQLTASIRHVSEWGFGWWVPSNTLPPSQSSCISSWEKLLCPFWIPDT